MMDTLIEDCDAFYASVEELDRPELKYHLRRLSLHRLVPMGVGQGVLTTSNYEARKYGVRSAMPSYIAKKLCPQLILLPLNFGKYIAKGGPFLTVLLSEAKEIREVIAKYDPNYMAASLDEAYLNMTSYIREHNLDPTEAISQLRAEIFEKTKITTSAGLGASTSPHYLLTKTRYPHRQNWIQQKQGHLTHVRVLISGQIINSFSPTIVKQSCHSCAPFLVEKSMV